MPELGAVHHIGLTVRELDTSVPWYTRVFGLTKVMEEPPDNIQLELISNPGT